MRDVDAVLGTPWHELPSADAVVAAAMEWHFDPATGSRFWVERAASLPFDPRKDITTVADLNRFPDVSDEWRDVPVEDLLPAGLRGLGRPPVVWESGGTTGAPKRTVDLGQWARNTRWWSEVLDQRGFPSHDGNLLFLGPTGPHVVAEVLREIARLRGAVFFPVDFDPRWVRRCLRDGHTDLARHYVDHLLDQAERVLASQHVSLLYATPPLLEAIAERPRLAGLVRDQVRGIMWGGTSMDPETLRLLSDEVFPGAAFGGLYGNTMMGGAPQRPAVPGDTHACVFQPFHPYVHLSLLDPDDLSREVAYGEHGRVCMRQLSPEVLLPYVLERDIAVRVAPVAGYAGDGVADVRPFTDGGAKIIEGVY
ncbi:phenazine biosynthesis protein [Streptomyces rimosus]|uniref:phenazine biosynthesis protein n=1 Tax=Streptomyces rimosus TaxID=1927 RepID=UPI00099C3FAD|nr:phenazine biosynthesis protein [Streptomyces rimosus]